MNVLGIPIDVTSRKGILERVESILQGNDFHQVVTVNPEFTLLAEKDVSFREALLSSDNRFADGIGITLAGFAQGRVVDRFPGADLLEVILKMCEERSLSVFLVIRKDGLSNFTEIKKKLLKKYPALEVSGVECDASFQEVSEELFSHDVVLCNFGAPKQEIFLSKLKDSDSRVKLAMGVGGSFDYITGKRPRAPKILRKIGLEWLWRLILQPSRAGRIWNAVVIFPFHLLFATVKK
ncbi:MAG: WecB/TagA/CpsF family glycosyltransferase [Patescibacteria group bacterium]